MSKQGVLMSEVSFQFREARIWPIIQAILRDWTFFNTNEIN
ncbi:hypothetical protein [uncultured Croceitalea sp.]